MSDHIDAAEKTGVLVKKRYKCTRLISGKNSVVLIVS